MNQADDTRKEHVLEGIGKALHKRLPASRRKLGRIYLAQCFRRVPVAELEREAPATWAAMVAGQLEFLAQRAPGEMLLRVFNPTAEAEGWESPHTLVEIVNDDRPFLVDTAALTLSELDIGIHRIIHPVVRVERDMLNPDGVRLGKKDRALHHVMEFANVPRPVVGGEPLQRPGGQGHLRLLAHLAAEAGAAPPLGQAGPDIGRHVAVEAGQDHRAPRQLCHRRHERRSGPA